MTTATDKLIVITSRIGTTVKSGIFHFGSPVSTASKVLIPHAVIGRMFVRTAPNTINTTAIGNFGTSFFATSKITRETLPSTSDGILICRTALIICSASSKNSPVPALPPISFGTCIKIIVVQIPVINPPITGSDI